MANNIVQGTVQNSRMNSAPYFVGFSTIGKNRPPYVLTDIDLIKRDLLNQFQTPMGERVMLPNFGTKIYNYLFDPFDDLTKNAIIEDAIRIISSEPRCELKNIEVFQQDHSLNLLISLVFQPNALTQSLFVSFEQQNEQTF